MKTNHFTRATLYSRTRDLMDHHGLQDWEIRIGSARNTAGTCNYTRKLITVSLFLANARDQENTVDTILHEIAHALTPEDRGHGKSWKEMCVRIGANPSRCFESSEIDPAKRFKYVGLCPNHQSSIIQRNRRKAMTCHCGTDIHWKDMEDSNSVLEPYVDPHAVRLATALDKFDGTLSNGDLIPPRGYLWHATDSHYIDTSSPYYTENDYGRANTKAQVYRALTQDVEQGTYLCNYDNCYFCKDQEL